MFSLFQESYTLAGQGMASKRVCACVLPMIGYGRTHVFGTQDVQLFGRLTVQNSAAPAPLVHL